MNKFSIFFLIGFVAGCGTPLPRHEKPATNETARIRFTTQMTQGSLYGFDDQNCTKNGRKLINLNALFPGLHGVNQKSIGMPGPTPQNAPFGEIEIDAEKPLYFAAQGVWAGHSITSCTGYYGMTPKKGRDYEIYVMGNPGPYSNCRISITEIVSSGAGSPQKLPVALLPTAKTDCPAAYDGGFR